MGVKFSVDETFFDTWSPSMAYVLGYLFSDGSMENASYIRGKYIRVTSTDLDRILLIRKLLRSKHTIVERYISERHKVQHLLRIGSHTLYARLLELGMTPRKSLTMSFPSVPDPCIPFFVLGYFDGDGCVYMNGRGSLRPTRLKTIFTSGSKKFLVQLQKILALKAGVTGGGLYAHGSTAGAFQLRYTARDSIRLFTYMYSTQSSKLALKRKYAIFTEYFKKAGITSRDFPSILDKKGPVVKR